MLSADLGDMGGVEHVDMYKHELRLHISFTSILQTHVMLILPLGVRCTLTLCLQLMSECQVYVQGYAYIKCTLTLIYNTLLAYNKLVNVCGTVSSVHVQAWIPNVCNFSAV